MTKSAFAEMVNLSPGRVSQLIAEGKIADCLVGEGRHQKIDADKAIEKLKIRRDPGQAMGNGAKTVLAPSAASTSVSASDSDDLDLKLKQAKLQEAEARNRRLAEEERERLGIYVRTSSVAADGGRMATLILQMFEAGLTEAAAEIAAAFKLPARDVQHLMRQRLRDVRTMVSKRLADEALQMPQLVEERDTV